MPANIVSLRRTSWRCTGLAVFLAGLLTLAVACSSSDDKGADANDATPSVTGGGDDGDLDDMIEQIRQLREGLRGITFSVTYSVSTEPGSALTKIGGDIVEFDVPELGDTIRLVSRPPSDFRIDFEDEELTGTWITTAADRYTCAGEAETARPLGDTVGFCQKTLDDVASVVFESFDRVGDPDGLEEFFGEYDDLVIQKSRERIAGEDVNCFRGSGTFNGNDQEHTNCYTDDGINLLVETKGSSLIEATELRRDISDSDFEPPFPDLSELLD